ncbi:MAG TPA: nicotinate-nucleotide--dimethylbenzimidazole phosphoribosyltransferase, partial [Lachnospiraceae bacterium]|nr:nicotinate-nucleotide--dimethylbenzimidazole phosphoribosyltransferase [Lachnospiraceae bacterium]
MDTIIKQFNKLENIKPADEQIYKKVLDRWDGIAKPLRGLGRFEEI